MYRKWQNDLVLNEDGIIVGSDLTQEWLLSWWWEHYRRFNSHPVTFIDFGMSQEKKSWCRERGRLVHLQVADVFVAEKQEMDPALVAEMEGNYGRHFWSSRQAWFKKPLACLQSPYSRSLWIDLDCEIRGAIDTLFNLCEHPSGLAIAKERDNLTYNSGVFAFKRDLPLIETWADQVFEHNHEFLGDQDILSKIIHEQHLQVVHLPLIYNWSRCWEENPQAVIMHWHGPHGKSMITHQIMKSKIVY